jgi:hypothetical protein
MVTISFQNPIPAGDPLAMGVFDTGNDTVSISPETNSLAGIPTQFTYPAPYVPVGTDPATINDAIVGNATTLTVGGYLGIAVGGPEVNSTAAAPANGPAHVFSTDTRRSAANSYQQTGISPSLTYFGAVASQNGLDNIGTAFVAGTATQNALVAEVDPTQAGYLPFALNDVTRAGLTAPSYPLNQTYSSVSFYASNSIQVPTVAANADPGFLTVLNLSDSENTNPGVNANFIQQSTTAVNGRAVGANPATTTGGVPQVTLAAGNPLGVAAGTYTTDTGAPSTGAPGGLLGTDILNGYGQYWNFQTSQILMFAPTSTQNKNIVGPGILFTTDRTSIGLAGTGVNQLATNGITPVMNNGGAPTVLPSAAPEQSSAIFRTQLTHSNAAYVSGIDALGLTNSDQICALSLGGDIISQQNAIFFSVDRTSQGAGDDPGVAGGGVMKQAALGKQSDNIYLSTTGSPLPIPGVNGIRYSGDLLGLGPNAGPTTAAAGRGQVDQLRDFVLNSGNGYYNANLANVQRNIDPTITSPGDVRNPGAGIAGNYGVRGDVYGNNFDTYFTLDWASPTRAAAGDSAADILVNNPQGAGAGFHVFAPAASLGLNFDDQINSLALERPNGMPTQTIPLQPGDVYHSTSLIPGTDFDPNYDGNFDGIDPFHGSVSDLALFTLARGSPDLSIFDPAIGRDLSPADVFVTDFDGTFALMDAAESLGLNPSTDQIMGMKPLPLSMVPEPGALALLAGSVVGLLGCAWRRRKQTG